MLQSHVNADARAETKQMKSIFDVPIPSLQARESFHDHQRHLICTGKDIVRVILMGCCPVSVMSCTYDCCMSGPITATGGLELGPVRSLTANLKSKWNYSKQRFLELGAYWNERNNATTLTFTGQPYAKTKVSNV